MIKEIVKSSPNRYGKYFLSMEAPDEELPKKSNTKVIDVKPNNRRRLDFTDGAEEIDDTIPEEEPSEEMPENNDIDYSGSDEDFSQDIDEQPEENQEQSPVDTPTDANTEPTINDGETEINDDTTNGPDTNNAEDFNADASDETGDNDGDIPDTDNAEDFTSDANGETGDDTAPTDAQPEDAKKGPGLEYDSTRKYNLFENYLSLSNAISNYISKLENNMGEDYNQNQIIKTATEKLREIHDLCYDYMTLKFEISSYVQSLLFFQNLVIMVQFVFDLLEKTNKRKNSNK